MSVLIKNMEIPEHCGYCRFRYDGICHALQKTQYSVEECPLVSVNDIKDAQPEDYSELKREFLRMASYIDVLLECSDEQKETLIGFISRLAEFMPWTEGD